MKSKGNSCTYTFLYNSKSDLKKHNGWLIVILIHSFKNIQVTTYVFINNVLIFNVFKPQKFIFVYIFQFSIRRVKSLITVQICPVQTFPRRFIFF